MKKMSIFFPILFLFFVPHVKGETVKEVEIFHIEKGIVVEKRELTPEIEKEIENILHSINGVYQPFNPIPEKGYMMKFPLSKKVSIQNKSFDGTVREVIIIFPEFESPHLMVFNEENNHFFLTFDQSVDSLLQLIEFKPLSVKQLD